MKINFISRALILLGGLLSVTSAEYTASSIVNRNVSRALFTLADDGSRFKNWTFSPTPFPITEGSGKHVTVAIIGDGVNYNLIDGANVVEAIDVALNNNHFDLGDVLTADTIVASVLIGNYPDVSIQSYKIFASQNATNSDTNTLIDAIDKAICDDDVDIILVTTDQVYGGWAVSGLSQLLNELSETKPIILPMGDRAGMFQFSDGAGAEKVITVGSSGSDGVPGWPFTLDDGEQFGVYGFTPANFYENNTLVYVEVDSDCSFGDIFAAEEEDTAVFEIPEACSEADLLKNLMKTNYTQFLAVASDNKYHLFDLATEDISTMIDGGQISLAEGSDIIEKLKNGENTCT
ncbi:unnamed protein product [Ambrosiozyma monospora]|uniref:Unnamed protein product n=1 Tax=Ambrosiozyma monospora TaxID=43982 RepID=A0A9W6Z8S3_AMBMO|nr:unnamed protein product [Ambrosiozyma monospora]